MTRLDGLRIMVVEDQYYLAADVARTLEREGADVVGPFSDQRGACAAIPVERIDCAVLDVNLGDGACFALADELRRSGVRFLFFTGYSRDVIPERFAAVARLEKPVDDAKLVRAIAQLSASLAHT